MNSMASAGPMANSMFVVTPHNGYPVVPGVMSQIPRYPSNQPQVHLIPGNPPGQTPYVSEQPARPVLKEGKVLGALQILIGLIHIGFGSILATVLSGYYIAISFYAGFPFWGSICLSGSMGMNIVSAISSVVGIMLFITGISIAAITFSHSDSIFTITSGVCPGTLQNSRLPAQYSCPPNLFLFQSPGMAISCVLLVFCLLEFCIACTASHFGCQLTCYQCNNVSSEPSFSLLCTSCALVFLVGMVFPNVYTANKVVVPEPENPPPEYSTQVPGSK
ncbi:membrane-spanning 4-domains subfamily A member 8 [Trichechus inunguis]